MQLKDYDSFPDTLPMVLEDSMFLYPFMIAPLFIESEENKQAVQYAMDNNKLLVIALSLEGEENVKDRQKKFYNCAIAGNVMRKVALPDGKIKVLFQGLAKIIIQEVVSNNPTQVVVDTMVTKPYDEKEINAILDILRQNISTLSKVNPKFPADLIKTIDVPLKLMMFGGKIAVETLQKEINVKIPQNSKNGQKLRLKGYGVANRGDLYLKLNVALPKIEDLDEELVELMKEKLPQ